jgi:hypothetical protein
MAYDIHIGDDVEWNWASGTGTGTVKERFTEKVTKTIARASITRNASETEPAYLIEEDGREQVQAASELTAR